MKLEESRLALDRNGQLPKARLLDETAVDRNLYTINEARERLGGMSRSFIYSLVKSGQLASVKVSRRRFIPKQAIDKFIANSVTAYAPASVRPIERRDATFASLRLPSSRPNRGQ